MKDDSLGLQQHPDCASSRGEHAAAGRDGVHSSGTPQAGTSALECAIATCERVPGYEGAGKYLERAEVNGNGIVLLHLVRPSGGIWLGLDGEAVRELSPRLDRSLPILTALEDELVRERWEVLSYRPGRRVVLAQASTVIKGYRPRRSAAAATRHRLAEAAVRAPKGFRVPRLLEHVGDTSSLLFERISGETLEILSGGAESFFAVGWALRSFQDSAARSSEELPVFSARDELAVLDRWAEKTLYAKGFLAETWRQVRDQLGQQFDTVAHSEPVLAHRDLHDRQLSRTAEGISLFDFDLLCRADPALDPANLLAHLSLRALQRAAGADEAAAQVCGQAFLDGLDRSDSTDFWPRLRFYQATTFLRLALVYGLRPRWSALCEDLIELGRRSLDDMREML